MSRRMAWGAFKVSFRITLALAWEVLTSIRKTRRKIAWKVTGK